MKFQPKTDDEINNMGALEGVYDFDIRAAKEYVSDKGNETFELELNVFDAEGTARPRKDWVTPAFAKKFKHLHDTCGMLAKYDAGETRAEDFIGKSGKLKMARREYTDKDGNKKVGDQVEDYIKRANMVEKHPAAALDDGIPF